MTVKLTEKNIQKEVYDCRIPVLVEFYASWCPKCAMMEDVLQKFAIDHREIKVCQVNEGEQPGLVNRFGIERVPYFVAFVKGKPVGAAVGIVSENILLELFSASK